VQLLAQTKLTPLHLLLRFLLATLATETLPLSQLVLDPSKPTTLNPVQATLSIGLDISNTTVVVSQNVTPAGPTNFYINAEGDFYINAAGDSYIQP
jgi:hypothetical protein